MSVEGVDSGAQSNVSDFEELVQDSYDAIWSVDREYRVRSFNRKIARDMYDGFGVSLAPGIKIIEQFEPEINSIWKRRYDRCFNGERLTVEDRYSLQGRPVYLENTLSPVRDRTGVVVAAAVVSRDITDVRLREEETGRLASRMQALIDSAAELTGSIRDPDDVYNETIAKLGASFTFDSATVQILEGDHLRVVAASGFGEDSPVIGMRFPLVERFPNYRVVTSGQVLALGDVRTDFPHFQTESTEFDSGHIRSWLGLPLIDRDGVIGMITLDRVAYQPFESEDVQLATGFAHHAAVAIATARLYKEIQESNRNQQTLLRELHHRVKNNMQLVSSLLNIRMGTMTEERSREVLAEVRTQVSALAGVHDSIYRSPTLEYVDLTGYAGSIVRDIEAGYVPGGKGIRMQYETETNIELHIDRAIPFGLLLSELLLNAIKHAFPKDRHGTITVRLDRDDREDWGVLTVADDGVGISGERDGNNVGISLVESLAGQINADVSVESTSGTIWAIRFPLS